MMKIIHVLFIIYVYALFKIILFKFGPIDISFLWQQLKQSLGNPTMIGSRLQQGNLIPFHEISRTIHDVSNHALFNLIGNIAIFMPFGIFLGLMARNKSISTIGVFIRSLGLSLCLESAQVIFAIGNFDVDDLILNASGGVMGFIVHKLCGSLLSKYVLLTKRGRMKTRYV